MDHFEQEIATAEPVSISGGVPLTPEEQAAADRAWKRGWLKRRLRRIWYAIRRDEDWD